MQENMIPLWRGVQSRGREGFSAALVLPRTSIRRAEFCLVKPADYPQLLELVRFLTALTHGTHLPATSPDMANLVFHLRPKPH